MCLTPPWDGLGGHKNSARLQPCGTKEKEREMRNLFPPIIKQIDEIKMLDSPKTEYLINVEEVIEQKGALNE